ncbi:MAG: methyltransferase domain-containing protein [Bacteroidales bacterium]
MEIPKNWTFKNTSVAKGFDSHVREQLPWYDLATNMVSHIARHYLPENGVMYDIGASTGNIGNSLKNTLSDRKIKFIAIEQSEEMAQIYNGPDNLIIADALSFEFEKFDVAVIFLVAMFMPTSKRRLFLERLKEKINSGGIIIIFDKINYFDGYLSTVMHRLTMSEKIASGASSEDVFNKEMSLSGIQRPLPKYFIKSISPTAVEVFRFGEFCGWIIKNDE